MFNVLFFKIGFPAFGSVAFLIFINCVQLFLFLSFPANIKYARHAYAGTLSLLSILMGILALFRGSQVALMLLGGTSITFSLIAMYLFALTQGTFGTLVEFLMIPFNLVYGWIRAVIDLTVDVLPKVFEHLGLRLKAERFKVNPMSLGAIVMFPGFMLMLLLTILFHPLVYQAIESFARNIGWYGFNLEDSLRLRLSLSMILFWLLMPVPFMRHSIQVNSPFRKDLYKILMLEVSMLVLAVTVIVSFFMVVQIQYFFLIESLQELVRMGIPSFGDYVRKGFWELAVVTGVVYGVAGIGIVVLRAKEEDGRSLRWLSVLMLLVHAVFTLSIFRRLFIYETISGLTRARAYGMMFLFVLLVMTLVFIIRFVRRAYQGWHILEFSVIVVCLLVTTIVDVDRIIVKYAPPLVDEQVDYAYISNLSSDAAEGWVDGYVWSKNSLDWLRDLDYIDMTDQDISNMYMAYETLTKTRERYTSLARLYGGGETVKTLENSEVPLKLTDRDFLWRQLLNTNLSQWAGYRLLTATVSTTEIVDYQELSAELISNYQKHKTEITDYPLVW